MQDHFPPFAGKLVRAAITVALPAFIIDVGAAFAICTAFQFATGNAHLRFVLQVLFGFGVLRMISIRVLTLFGVNFGLGEFLIRAEPAYANAGPWATRFGIRLIVVALSAGELARVAAAFKTPKMRLAVRQELARLGLQLAGAAAEDPFKLDPTDPES